ncbi:thiamine phosphate synthase [Novacetimonas maltaceti]|uniref:Thiamine-phosphate synthase n=1 Tax=Novacetimonas maltaceti TaxID=1203393 RepID=A0A2S3W2R1_9PROT|nr:thiamine phosphate synthase [Novacetimonas maltaceti]POF63149.1 thiamine-phosphate pyrophosphorylase [Novacetimonas maltaceti]PYD60612.1 thiamine phosphate synthase [Novacetimonas maltaceti]
MTDCQLYLVTPESLDPPQFAPLLARALDAGPVAAVQLRLKDVPDDTIRRAIDVLRPVAHERDVAFILNDRPDLARATGCDGAHVGMEDMSVEDARRILGDDLQLGVSCYDSRDMAMRAGEGGADYVAFGAFFPSPSKETSVRAGTDLLTWWSSVMELPVVAIGGITPENCPPLVRAGADFLAVISAVWSHPDGPGAGVRAMNAAMDAASDGID